MHQIHVLIIRCPLFYDYTLGFHIDLNMEFLVMGLASIALSFRTGLLNYHNSSFPYSGWPSCKAHEFLHTLR